MSLNIHGYGGEHRIPLIAYGRVRGSPYSPLGTSILETDYIAILIKVGNKVGESMSSENEVLVDVERGWVNKFVPDAPLRANLFLDIFHTTHNVVTPNPTVKCFLYQTLRFLKLS